MFVFINLMVYESEVCVDSAKLSQHLSFSQKSESLSSSLPVSLVSVRMLLDGDAVCACFQSYREEVWREATDQTIFR